MTQRPSTRSNRVHTSFGSRTDVGCVRDHNEDSLVVAPPLYMVADGMGGHAAGEVASEIAVRTMENLAPHTADTEALCSAVNAANMAVIDAAQVNSRRGMGTTLSAVVLERDRMAIAQVGDSRVYLLHQSNLQQITRDHSLMAEMIEAGELTEEEARVHPQRSVITRALGSDPNMTPDLYELNVSAGDRLLICSDGLTSMIEDSEVERLLLRHRDPQRCANALVNEAISEGGLDNVTAIVVDVEGNAARVERTLRIKSRAWAIALIVALLAVIGGACVGAYHYTQSAAYLTAENGVVCVYQGVPGSVAGISLSHLAYETNIDVGDLQPGVSNRLQEGPIRVDSMQAAEDLIASYERDAAESKTGES